MRQWPGMIASGLPKLPYFFTFPTSHISRHILHRKGCLVVSHFTSAIVGLRGCSCSLAPVRLPAIAGAAPSAAKSFSSTPQFLLDIGVIITRPLVSLARKLYHPYSPKSAGVSDEIHVSQTHASAQANYPRRFWRHHAVGPPLVITRTRYAKWLA